MRESLPFEPHERSLMPTLAERAFRAKLKAELQRLRRVFDQAHVAGLSMGLQEEYSCLREWFHLHSHDVRVILTASDEPRNGIATWTLEGRTADRLYRLISPSSLNADPASDPRLWRAPLASLIKEVGGGRGKTDGCPATRSRTASGAPKPGTGSLLADLS